jgi:hypothetical protein
MIYIMLIVIVASITMIVGDIELESQIKPSFAALHWHVYEPISKAI